MKLSIFRGMDYSMLSSYLGKVATVVIFAAIVLLAVGSIFIREEDAAHSPINIGVCAFDSVRTWYIFDALSSYVISRGGGDVRWKYFSPRDTFSGCDVYLATSIQASPYIRGGRMRCALIVAREGGKRYCRGLVISGRNRRDRGRVGKVVFSSPISASGYAASFETLRSKGIISPFDSTAVFFADMYLGTVGVFYGVIYGAFELGCVEEWDFHRLSGVGTIDTNSVVIALESEPVIELVLTVDTSADKRKTARFIDRLMEIYSDLPNTLEAQLSSIGMAQLIPLRDGDEERIKELASP